jgi:regulator of protease activity HflC (stomatin/prohibitin superfamily)
MDSSFFILILLSVIILGMSIKVIREDERIVVFRLGRFFRVSGPGLVLILPIIDKVIRINLPEKFPGWRGFSREELEDKIKELVL